MTTMEDIRRTVSESRPMRAAVGATDLAVERARKAWGKASSPEAKEQAKERLSQMQKSVGDAVTGFDPKAFREKVTETLDPKTLQNTASRLPGWAVSGMLQVAGKAEAQYESLAERGKVLLEKAKNDPHAKDLMDQGKQAVGRTRTAVVTVRKKVDDRTGSVRTATGRGHDTESRIPEPSAPSEPEDEASATPTPVAAPPKTEPPEAPVDQTPEETSPTPVATPPKKSTSTRKRTSSGASSTARARKTSAKRSSTTSGGSSKTANGRKRTTPPPDADSK